MTTIDGLAPSGPRDVALDRTDEQRALQRLAHELAAREIRPVVAHHDETEEPPWGVLWKATEVGLTCADLPERYSGGGVTSLLTGCLMSEELAWGDPAISSFITSADVFAAPVVMPGAGRPLHRACRVSQPGARTIGWREGRC